MYLTLSYLTLRWGGGGMPHSKINKIRSIIAIKVKLGHAKGYSFMNKGGEEQKNRKPSFHV